MSSRTQPPAGQVVHYSPSGATHDSECMAAIVTFAGRQGNPAPTVFWPPLACHADSGALTSVPEPRVGEPLGHTWHWPERT